MYSHLIHEDAYHKLTRARNAINALYYLLETGNPPDVETLVGSKGLSAITEYICDDLANSIQGCKEVENQSRLSPSFP